MSSDKAPAFRFVDLFAGIGGFHAALGSLGGECVYASEIDPAAQKIYAANWDVDVAGDITTQTKPTMLVPEHDVLAAGFPCQPFSKSGLQRGMEETRGTMFWHILEILRVRRPGLVLLENVRNIAGPRHRHEWDVIVRELRSLGYAVSSEPAIFSPHLLPESLGGRPQVRERVFIVGVHVGLEQAKVDVSPVVTKRPVGEWDPQRWTLDSIVDRAAHPDDLRPYRLSTREIEWIEAWETLVARLRRSGVSKLPGFPIWADYFVPFDEVVIPDDAPLWKQQFIERNCAFYEQNRRVIDTWLEDFNGLSHFPPSRRKLEWQAQDAASFSECVLHFRPSGIRVKKATYVPALVAITQTTILGDQLRRITPREAARLQGLPDDFDLGGQPDSASYKQLGNGVNVGVVHHVARELMISAGGRWARLAESSPKSPYTAGGSLRQPS